MSYILLQKRKFPDIMGEPDLIGTPIFIGMYDTYSKAASKMKSYRRANPNAEVYIYEENDYVDTSVSVNEAVQKEIVSFIEKVIANPDIKFSVKADAINLYERLKLLNFCNLGCLKDKVIKEAPQFDNREECEE